MKNFITTLFLFCAVNGILFSQTNQRIVKTRYWLNNPSPVGAVEVNPTAYSSDSNTVNFSNITVDVSALSSGLHILYSSTQDANGSWGAAKTTSFIIGSIVKNRVTKIRYWFNNQTASNAIEIITTPTYNADSTIAVLQNVSVDISSLSAGLNRLYVSAQDANGKWGAPNLTSIFIGTISKTFVVKGQYWFDNPVPTSPVDATPTYIGDSTKVSFSNIQIDISSLSDGQHTLYFRTQDNNGKWGTAQRSDFTIGGAPKKFITKGQYWFNNPAPTSPVDLNPTYVGDSTRVTFTGSQIDVSSLPDGQHMLYFRTQDNAGRWGSAQVTIFSIGSVTKKYIAKGQYWFSNQTVANATDFTPEFVGDSSKVSENLSSITVPNNLPNGKYSIYVRFQDAVGKWGIPAALQFVQNASLAPPTISQMEYFFGNTDPGQGTASQPRSGTITGIGGRSTTFLDSYSIDSLGLPLGANKFSVRFKSNKDEWGPTISNTFAVLTRPEFYTSLSDTLRFGNLYSGRDTKKDSFYIRNKGDADLKVIVKTLPSSQWSVKFGSGQDSAVIAKDSFTTDSVKVVVTFKPVKAGYIANAIVFGTNDTSKGFAAIVPVAAMADSAIGKMTTSVDTIRFGKVAINAKKTFTLIVGNVGIDSIQVVASSSNNNYFPVQQPNTYRKIGYQSTTDTIQIKVLFTPFSQGNFSANFTISSVNLQYQYIESKIIYIEGEGVYIQNPTIDVDKSVINFGGVNARAPQADSIQKSLAVANLGQNVLTVDSIVSSNKNIFKVISTDLPTQVYNSNSLNLTLRFTPPTGVFQSYNETLTIYNNSTDSNQVVVIPMMGDATDGPPLSVFALSDSVIDFGTVTKNFNLSKNITIRNKGVGVNKALHVTSLSISNGLFTTTQTVPFQVAAGDSQTLAINFAPTSIGIASGNLAIETDANVRPLRSVDLKGNGVITPQPILETPINPLVFSPTKLNTPNAVYFKFKNAGNATLQADSIFMVKQTAFFTVNKSKSTLAPNEWDSLLITFTPQTKTTYTDSLIFLSNLNPQRYGIPVTGKGEVLAIAIDTNVTPSNPQVINGNQSVQIGVSLTASLGSGAVAFLFYKLSGETLFDSVQMTSVDGIHYQGVIPADKIGDRGAVYYVKVSNGVETILLTQSFVSVVFPAGITKSQDQPAGTQQTNYRMISIPLSGISTSVDTVMKNFGAYDKTKWRLFRYQGTSVGYVEHNAANFQSFAPGRGYWFITSAPQKIRSGSGQATPANGAFNIDLQSEWNQIGNPFTFAVSWDSVTGKGANVGALFDYDGTDYVPVTSMQPWAGYFVKNTSSNPVTINIRPAVPSGALAKSMQSMVPKLLPNEWMLQLKATDGEISDNSNYIGVKKNASDTYDENDVEESPRQPGEYLKLTFNNTSWSERPDKYGYDFRSSTVEGKYWDFEINTSSTHEKITLNMDMFASVPEQFDIILLDIHGAMAQNLRKNTSWSFVSAKKEMTKQFRIIVGTKAFIEKNDLGISLVPKEYGLNQNYPNPFNPTTTVKYALPTASNVTMKVYDILGKEVATIVNGTVAEGYHVILWDATNSGKEKVASGVYFCRIAARSVDGSQQYSRTIKMILMK